MAINISNLLSEEGYYIVLCSSRKSGSLEHYIKNKVYYECLFKRSFIDIKAFLIFLKLIRKHEIEIVHAHSTSIYWAILSKLFFFKIKIVWHDHDGNSENLKKNDRILIKIFSIFIDYIIVVNESLRKWSQQNTFVKTNNIIFIRNFPHIQNTLEPKNNHPNLFSILCLANFRDQKDHLTLLRALDILINERGYRIIKTNLVGLYRNDNYFSNVNNYIKNKNLESHVFILGSITDPSDLLSSSDLGVLSSKSEGLPVSLLEYGLAGLPVVVTNVGQCADVVGGGTFGHVVPRSDYLALANAIEWHILNRNESSKLGKSFKIHTETEYGAYKFLNKYNQLLINL